MGLLDRFSKGPAKPDAFTIEVVARIRALDGVDRVEAIDADTVAVTWAGRSEPERIEIGHSRPAWKEVRGFDRIELLDRFIAGLSPGAVAPVGAVAEEVAGWAAVHSTVLPALRRARRSDDGLVSWPVGELLEATAVEAPGAAPITDAQCEDWGVAAGEVRDTALTNLEAFDPAPDAIGPGEQAWVATSPAELPSSWLARPAPLLERVGLSVGIVLVPLQSELVIVDPDDADLVQTIVGNTLTIVEQRADILCPVPFLVAGGAPQVWEPPSGHPASELVERTRALLDR